MLSPVDKKRQEVHLFLIHTGALLSCISCTHYCQQKELCKKWQSKPPAKIIVIGCDSHSPDIPF